MAMFPIRCVVETIADGQCTKCSDGGSVLVDSYAIVSGFTQLSQLVETVLTALGLQHLCYGAQGTIQVKNWKPLTFEEVTNDPDIEVENLLKDISNHLTLRILAKQSDNAVSECVRDMKDRLLQAVWHKLPHVANDIQQPQLKELVTNLIQGDVPQAIDAQSIYMFNLWLEQMNKGNKNGIGGTTGPSSWANAAATNSNGRMSVTAAAAAAAAAGSRFSATLEIPKLERWFRENQNPTRQKLLQYMTLMNNSSYRKHAAKITYQQICNWFINARASMRKRGSAGANSQQQQLTGGGRRSAGGAAGDMQMSSSAAANVGGESGDNAADSSQTEPGGGSTSTAEGTTTSTWSATRSMMGAKTAGTTPPMTCGAAPTLSFNSLMNSKLSTVLSDGDAAAVAMVTDESCASPSANGQRSPSASSRTSGELGIKEEGSSMDDSMAPSAADQELCPPLYFNSISMTSRPDGVDGATGADLLSASPLMENGGSSSRAGTPSSTPYGGGGGGVNANRTRLMFDPLTELPMLERWFEENPHPSWVQVDQFTEMLNVMPYRQTYPPVSAHNVKIWFKNRRAKFKRNLVGAAAGKADGSESSATVN